MSRARRRRIDRRRPPGRVWAVGCVLVASAVLTGCGADGPSPSPTAGPTSAENPTPSASSSAAPSAPTLDPDGSAADNLALFAAVTEEVWASGDRAAGRAYIDALVGAGFDQASMQVTQDQSTVGNPAESIQFAVKWGDECLVGQVGPATGDPFTVVVAVTDEGTCLIGATRPIDW